MLGAQDIEDAIQANPRLAAYIADARDAIELKLVADVADFDRADLAFRPEFTHQVFDSEKIFGYKNPRVRLYHAASDLKAFVDFRHDGAISAAAEGVGSEAQPDDVVGAIAKYLPKGYTSKVDDFVALLATQDRFVPPGCKVKEYRSSRADDQDTVYEVYKCKGATPGFAAYHERLQTFLLWFIEAASFIDLDDGAWTVFVLYAKRRTSVGGSIFRPVGYATLYDFYAYPDGKRPRISQMVIFPPYQRRGHGAALLQSLYDDCKSRPEVVDITVEDPSPEFVKLRDYVDCRNLLQLPAFLRPPEALTPDIVESVRQQLRINRRQVKHVHEILRFRALDKHAEAERHAFRLFVKRRLAKELDAEREECDSAAGDKAERLARLADLYLQEEDYFKEVAARLDRG